MGQSRDSDLAAWPAKRAPFWGTKHAMVFVGGWYVWHNNPVRPPFWGTKHACMVFAGLVCLAHQPPYGPLFGAQNTHVWCLRGWYVWRTTPPYGPFLGHKTRVPNPAGALTCIRRGARNSPLIRPAGWARRSVPNPAGALTCIRWCARNSPLIRPAGFVRRSVPQVWLGVPSRGLPGPSLVSERAPGTRL